MEKKIALLWRNCTPEGDILVKNGKVTSLNVISVDGSSNIIPCRNELPLNNEQPSNTEPPCNSGLSFEFKAQHQLAINECRLDVVIQDAVLEVGACSALVSVNTKKNPFSFFLRDVNSNYPIYIPEYNVIVTDYEDKRSYDEIRCQLESSASLSKLEKIENEPEESFENASNHTRNLKSVTWLGLSRDIRNFEVGFRTTSHPTEVWDWIKPKYHNRDIKLPELGGESVRYDYFFGRGLGCEQNFERWLEDRILPILNARHIDEDIIYETKLFAQNEKSPLTIENVKGTHYLVADEYSYGSMFTKEQKEKMNALHDGELERDEETVVYIKIDAVNTSKAPKYCWVKIPQPNVHVLPDMSIFKPIYDGSKGYGMFKDDRIYLIATLNGKPVPQEEMAVLLNPGEKAEYIFKIPHRPISEHRANELKMQDYYERLDECVDFWKEKFSDAAKIDLPEKRIDEMVKAGILHLDLVCYGNEPKGAVAPVVGCYSPIGSESSPIIQYLESVGKNDLARRAIMYFIEKQHDDGFIQNFGGYMLETGAVLWNVGEHYRYTQDIEWIKSIKENIIKSCEYIIRWRERNKKEELRGNGYGMIEGKVADPEDPYHSYMLNGYAYLGLARSAEVLKEIDPLESKRINQEAEALKSDIRVAIRKSIAECPVVPLGDGSWCPSISPWTENRGPLCLYVEPGKWYTHATVTARDAICGSMYLLLQEVVDPNELYGDFILRSFTELFYMRNVAFSQPYYSPHPYANLKRGEVKAFLKEYYNNVSGLADRETYTFWEHYHYASSHKTHEEGWFLMRSRWMLYMEDGDTLKVLPGIPRNWLDDGKSIKLDGMQTYFGPIAMEIKSNISIGKITVYVKIDAPASRLPKTLNVRIPHPRQIKATKVSSGQYKAETETITIKDFNGVAEFEVRF